MWRAAAAALCQGTSAPAAAARQQMAAAAAFSTSSSMQQQQQQQSGDLSPGQASLASLIDYEKQGVPKAAGVAPSAPAAAAAAAGSGGGGGVQEPKGFDLGTMHSLLAALGNPQQQLSVVHIAGTKGKGSVAALMSGVLRAAGYKVGTYTSPHMFDIRERIVVGGVGAPDLTPSHTAAAAAAAAASGSRGSASAAAAVPAAVPVSAEQFEALALRAADAVANMSQPDAQQQQQQQGVTAQASSSSSKPSHFEVVTGMALQHFVNESVDIAIIETGLGGATDATNVFTPQQLQLAVLTAVGMDHVDALGGSLESIAAAKAGVMKPGVPVVVGPQERASSSSSSSSGTGSGGGDSSSSSGGDGGASSGSGGVVLRVLRAAAAATDMQCPLVLAEDVVKVQPVTAPAAVSSSSSGGTVILPGPGEHLARQLLSVRTNASTPAFTAAAAAAAAAAASVGPVLDVHLPSVQLQLVGQHQAGNVQTAVTAAQVLAARGWAGVTQDAILRGLETAWLPGRFQVARLPDSPTHYVLDGAHTADSAAALASTLRSAFPDDPVVLLVAMAADKQHREVLQALRAIRPRVAVFTSVPIAGSHARSAPPGTLAAHWQAAAILSTGKHFRCRDMIQAGLGAALDKARHELGAYNGKGVVVVTGSLHAVAAGLKHLQLA